MQLPDDLRKRIRQIEFATRKKVDDLMSGQFRTSFKGQGVAFSEHRQYVPGDDVRHIDWKVSARSRDPLIKKYEEERELTVLLIVDVSGSGGFGSHSKLKGEIAAEIAGMLAYAAVHTGDKIGALLFSAQVEKIIPPKKGRSHVQRIIQEVLTFQPERKGTNLGGALESAHRVLKHKGVVFILSDFISPNGAVDYAIPLKRLARKHDVICMRTSDARESEVPDVGVLLVTDPETGEDRWVDTGSYAFQKWFKERAAAHAEELGGVFKAGKAEELVLRTEADYGEAVVRFFRARASRRR